MESTSLDEKDCPEPERLAKLIKKAILSAKEKPDKAKEKTENDRSKKALEIEWKIEQKR